MNDILEFQGQYRWLSNFWPCVVLYDGYIYPSVENAYQAAKLHPSRRAPLRGCTPAEAKRMAKGQEPANWVCQRVPIMRGLIEQKFIAGSNLASMLLDTGDVKIVEGNTWGDTFWGRCRGKGCNTLGVLLMDQRTYLRSLVAPC